MGFLFTLSLFTGELLLSSIPQAEAQHHGVPPPPANLGGRKVALNFETNPKVISTSQTVNMKIGFEDLGKQQNVQQVTFRMEVSKGRNTLSSDFFYGSNEEVNLQFRPTGSLSPTINGNDNGLGAWMADPGSPIVISGKIFSIRESIKPL